MKTQTDFTIRDEGNIFLLCPGNQNAEQWINKNLFIESWQRLGNNIAIDYRFFEAIYNGILESGLTVN